MTLVINSINIYNVYYRYFVYKFALGYFIYRIVMRHIGAYYVISHYFCAGVGTAFEHVFYMLLFINKKF